MYKSHTNSHGKNTHHSVKREDFPDKAQRNMIVFQKNAETLVNAHKRMLCYVTAARSC